MTDADLDASYTALCQALAEVGEGRSQLLLAMLSLALLARSGCAADVLPLIAKARASCLQEPATPVVNAGLP